MGWIVVSCLFGWHIVQVLERRNYDNTESIKRTKAREILYKADVVVSEEDASKIIAEDGKANFLKIELF